MQGIAAIGIASYVATGMLIIPAGAIRCKLDRDSLAGVAIPGSLMRGHRLKANCYLCAASKEPSHEQACGFPDRAS